MAKHNQDSDFWSDLKEMRRKTNSNPTFLSDMKEIVVNFLDDANDLVEFRAMSIDGTKVNACGVSIVENFRDDSYCIRFIPMHRVVSIRYTVATVTSENSCL